MTETANTATETTTDTAPALAFCDGCDELTKTYELTEVDGEHLCPLCY